MQPVSYVILALGSNRMNLNCADQYFLSRNSSRGYAAITKKRIQGSKSIVDIL